MERMTDLEERLQRWLNHCVPHHPVCLKAARNLRQGVEREVWDCRCQADAGQLDAILVVFRPSSLEAVNTNLTPELASEKCFLAMRELPALGIPTPTALGWAVAGGEAAVLYEKVERMEWVSGTRVIAAGVLARLHNLREARLSRRLQKLVRLSDPREHRTTGGRAPRGKRITLVHGDYFSRNILPVAGGLCIVDWETFARGDPMWDLGFLIGADRDLTDDEVEAVIAEYASSATVDRERLMWHKQEWAAFWRARERRSVDSSNAGHVS